MTEEDDFNVLYKFLNNIRKVNEEELSELKENFIPKTYKKGEFVTEYGKPADTLVFITDGFLRDYMIDLKGNEVTIYLSRKNDFIGAITSFLKRERSEENIQAITDTRLLEVSYEKLMHMYESSHNWALIGLHIMQGLFMQKQKKVNSFIKKTAEERYRFLVENEKEILQNVPNIYIASYLGITPETLSRIRARIGNS